ncbi:MAG: PAS domain S-box protein [Flavobacteriales bacterium]|jgi:PAS domain S-box-containing protein|nr:PAS domain S-box protein [Flavobacteriales bacterium]MBK7102785.1 PAS domain S-box protein [Flavobacteriales bacterium]MBK7113609.1 PAS domain S-box protein [Flavobacteriales bacterium]MBK7482406.1 PAS domain S-box protein [Flavobacteriales bacterium]MBK7619840.1 PAS domain S-box protein [Flavobacteriales bacterium]
MDPVIPSREIDLEKAYASLKRQYDGLVNRNLAGVFRTDLDGKFLECNDALARILGYTDRDELMRNSASVIYPSAAERDRFLHALSTQKHLVNFELTLKHKNGRAVEVLENVYLDEPEDGPATIQGTLIDVTAIRQAEIEQASLTSSYRSLVEHMRDGVVVVQGELVRYANPAAQNLLHAPLIGFRAEALFEQEDQPLILDLIQKGMDARNVAPVDAKLAGPKGRVVTVFAAHALHEGQSAIQLTLQDEEVRRNLLRERLRVQMAEEVNQVLCQEIEEHRHTQEALRHSRRFARSIVDSSLDMIMAADTQGRISEYNPAAQMRFGYEVEEVIGSNTLMLYVDPTEFARIQNELNTYGAFAGEVRNVSKDGEVFTSYLAASRLYDEDGQYLGAMGVSRDITRMKEDQEKLRASEERYRDLFENASDLIQSVDVHDRFEYVNDAWKRTLGYSDEDLRNIRLEDVVLPELRDEFRERHARVMAGEAVDRIRTVFLAKDGREVHVEGTTNLRSVDGKPVSTRSIFTDKTHVDAAREQVQQHEAKLKALFESSEHMFWTVDLNIKLTSFNRGYGDMIQRLYGKRPEINTDPDRPRVLFASKEHHGFWEAKYAEAFAGRPIRFETDLRDQAGDRVCNEIFLSPVFDTQGEVVSVFGVGHEITEQKLAEDQVREKSARLQAIFQSSANMMIWTLDKDFRITSCNEHFQRTVRSDFGIELAIGDVFLAESAEKAAGKRNERYLEKYRSALRGKPQQFEAELTDLHGQTTWVENFLNPIVVDGAVQEISCLAYIITDRKSTELRLRNSLNEKEVLLREVHHRVKNNLQIITSILNLQTAHVDGDERILELLRISRDRVRSMSFIHESLYQSKDFSFIDMATYIDGLSRNLVMSYDLSGVVSLERDLHRAELVLDQAIPCGLILNEIISNAFKHAFPDKRAGVVRIGLRMNGERVSISVADNGIGLPKGFDTEKGGNLGSELVRTLVEQLDGKLEIKSGAGVAYLLTFDRSK